MMRCLPSRHVQTKSLPFFIIPLVAVGIYAGSRPPRLPSSVSLVLLKQSLKTYEDEETAWVTYLNSKNNEHYIEIHTLQKSISLSNSYETIHAMNMLIQKHLAYIDRHTDICYKNINEYRNKGCVVRKQIEEFM